MNQKQRKELENAVKQIAGFKPIDIPKKPEKVPSAEQLKQQWKLVQR